MQFVNKTFVDEVVYLDNNTFVGCAFEGCELRYDGGPFAIVDGIEFKTHNRVKYGPGVDAFDNSLSQFLVDGIIRQGGVQVDPETATEPPITPKKDLG